MRANPFYVVFAALALTAGCVGPGPEGERAGPADTAIDTHAAAHGATQVSWHGYAPVGAAGDAWMHVNPPEQYLNTVWNEGFLLAVHGNITAMELRMDWEATPEAEASFMIHSPHDEDGVGMTEYTTQFSSDRHPCFRLPRADLEAIQAAAHMGHGGYWYPMFHPQGGVDYVVNLTVEVIGGTLEIVDGPHGHDPANPAEMTALLEAGVAPGATLACRGPLGDEP